MVYTLASMIQNICVRLKKEEGEPERWIEILRRGYQKDPSTNKSDIARALFKFQPYEEGLLTEEDRQYFLLGREQNVERRTRTKVIARSLESQPEMDVAKPRKRRTG